MRLERVPTPPPLDLSRQPRATEMPAVPPAPVEKDTDDAQVAEDLPVPPPGRALPNASQGMWRGRNTLDVTEGDTFVIPVKCLGKKGPECSGQDDAPGQGTGEAAVASPDFSSLKPAGRARVKTVVSPLVLQTGNGKLLQFAGIDIPEIDPYRTGQTAVAAQEALATLVAGKELTLYVGKDRNRGRTNRLGYMLVHAVVEGDKGTPPVWIQGFLLEKGLARVRPEAANPEMAEAMLALEARARQAGAGLWAQENYRLSAPEDTPARIGTFQIVEGTVVDVATVRNTVYLNFGKNWRTDFSAGIESSARVALARAGLKPLEWKGRRMRVRGFVEERNGPYIAIDTPGQLEWPDNPPEQHATGADGTARSSLAPLARPEIARPDTARPASPPKLPGIQHIQIQAPRVDPVKPSRTGPQGPSSDPKTSSPDP